MKQDKAKRERWSCCERVRRLIKLMSESFSLMRAISWKKIIKESDGLSDKIIAAINYFDGTNIICIWWDVKPNQIKNALTSQIYNGVYEFTQAWKPLVLPNGFLAFH